MREETAKTDPLLIEMVAAVIGVLSFATESDSFGYRHMIIGSILALYVLPGFNRSKSLLATLVFCAVFSLLMLLVFGKGIDFFRDSHIRGIVTRDVILSLTWLFLFLILLVINLAIECKRKVSDEAR